MARLVVSTRNARFQQWQSLLANRSKRHRSGAFLVHGVRPITLAMRYGWPIQAILHADGASLSGWARDVVDHVAGARSGDVVAMAPELLGELGEKDDDVPELVAVVELPADDLDRIPERSEAVVVAFDRPSSPGNIGTVVRSADAFGAAGVVIAGHAADPYDPKAVRASTGSLFALPVVRAASAADVVSWARARGLRIVGTDEGGEAQVDAFDLKGPLLLVVGNETTGLSAGWREACDAIVAIPMAGAASSLNAAAAATVALYEIARQRRPAGPMTAAN